MSEKLVTIARFRFEYRALLLKEKLLEAGIPCAVTSENAFRQLDETMVLVKESDNSRASEVVEEFNKNMKEDQ